MAETLQEGLDRILNDVQGRIVDKNICKDIVKVLNYDGNPIPQSIQKLLEICIQDPKDDVEYATEILNVISIILRKITAGEFTSKPDLLPSMIEILRMINTSIYSCKSDKIKVLYFKTLISYPDEVYCKLEEDNEILELFNLYVHQRIPIELRIQPINVLHKYLRVLSSEKKLKFVEQGINIWLLKLVPNVMLFVKIPDFETSLAALEMIVDEFIYIDYYDNPNFHSILQCFYEPQKYPTLMKNLLAKGCDFWHRLWIVFIKILKNQLTKSGSTGSPINSMLPVVETAFKLDVTNRCYAFQCWNALIDNFATETNEAYINKRIKLLVIPLYSNNAKVEETVIAKINTWWHLICSYNSKLSNFAEIILIPFLQFCFGKSIDFNKGIPIPGNLTDKTKEYCVEAFVNIFGHHNCDGCVSLFVFKDKIMNDKSLLASKKDIVYCFNAAIKIVANCTSKLRQPYQCAWMSFIKLIGDITDVHVKRDLFNELLIMIENLIQDMHDEILADIVLNDLIINLFKDYDLIMQLLNPMDEQESPMYKIFSITLNPSLYTALKRNDMTEAVENFKPFADFIVSHCFHTTIIEAFLNQLLPNYNSLVLWYAITSSVCEKQCETCLETLYKFLRWPLEHLDLFTKVEFCTSVWLALFDFVHNKLGTSSIIEDIFEVLTDSKNMNATNLPFFLNVGIALLTQKICTDNKGVGYEEEVWLVYDISSKLQSLNHTDPVFSKLLDLLVELFKKLLRDINLDIAKKVFMILGLVFTLLLSDFKKSKEVASALLMKVEQVLKSVEELLKLEAYASLRQIVLTEFLEYASCFGQQRLLKVTILGILEMFLKSMDTNDASVNTVKNIITSLKEDSNSVPSGNGKFTTPKTKKANKKETSIVNTVVEDGEEFVVVKSNWKFNPKKLTDNQKEKLKRKREDIPALYQDLSQSQDEFKLSTWKTDSQDTTTTTTSSKSNELTTSEKVSSILKNIPNTDVVPKILKNILPTENNKKKISCQESTNELINEIQTPINKEGKPRLSLKDRVFRNVKILMEKSDVQDYEKHTNPVINDATPQLQTPPGMRIKNYDTNSAPSEINSDRPSRMKRKPKKFEEMEIFATKKRRHSQCNNESQNKDSMEDLNHCQNVTEYVQSGEIKANLPGTVFNNQENQTTRPPDLTKSETNNDVQTTNILDINHKTFIQDENIDNQQQNSKSNVIAETSQNIIENNIVINNSTITTADTPQTNKDELQEREDISLLNSSSKKAGKKKSRIEKELAIDMVEGHPFLKVQSDKRLTRKKALESSAISRRKSLTQKLNKSKIGQKNTPKVEKKIKEIDKQFNKSKDLDTFSDSQESSFQDENGSQDIIESSQDSTVSIMSVKSSKTVTRISVLTLENIEYKALPDNSNEGAKSSSTDSKTEDNSAIFNNEKNDDTEFPLNKTAIEHVEKDLTENFDTDPIGNLSSNEVIVINSVEDPPIAVNLNDTYIDMDTQDIADADTQPMDLNSVATVTLESNTPTDETKSLDENKFEEHALDSMSNIDLSIIPTQEESTRSLTESLLCGNTICKETEQDKTSSKLPSKNEEERKRDFLNNTLEISPIRTLSPVRENKSPSPETSSDYVVIKLSSPVQSNGEPFEKCDSPEIFTEEKVSPDNRDQSPPREETRGTTASPRSLSLKKNKLQVRSGRRAAQMLGLCIPAPDRLQTILNSEKSVEPEESKKSSPLNSSARRNLRILYNSTNENIDPPEEIEESNSFLKMKRNLPAADSSPSVPILKRKLADIADDTTVSPANKRKRVSFHDPPVSTTVCVKKYIEASSVRSPQNSSSKRQEKQSRFQVPGNFKSQKRLDTVFKLENALTIAIESFSEGDETPNATEDTEMSTLEPTPLVEVVKNCELNNVDPICLDLINCEDPVDNIAGDLSSSAMRPLLVREFAGKIETVGDLAKMSELEVNRLCIKAPKVQVAKKVLSEYVKKINIVANEITPETEAAFSESTVLESEAVDVEMQTDCVVMGSIEVQTEALTTSLASTQTNTVSTADNDVQTDESDSKPIADIVMSLMDKQGFCHHLNEMLDVSSKQRIATSLPLNVLTDSVLQQIGTNSTVEMMDKLLEKHSSDSINGRNDNPRLSFIRDYLSERFTSKDLILFCSDLLKMVHDSK